MSTSIRSLKPQEFGELVAALGDAPETVIPLHLLEQGLACAWVAGALPNPAAIFIQSYAYTRASRYPWGFGADAGALWDLLSASGDWDTLYVRPRVARALGRVIELRTGSRVQYQSDPYYTLTRPVDAFRRAEVRQLTLADGPLLDKAPEEIRGSGWRSSEQMLREGVVAGAVIDDRLVASAYVSSLTRRYTDIGVGTLGEWCGKGFATAAASLVAARVQVDGRTPVWTTAEDNGPTQRVREKLGFVAAARLTAVCVIPCHVSSNSASDVQIIQPVVGGVLARGGA